MMMLAIGPLGHLGNASRTIDFSLLIGQLPPQQVPSFLEIFPW